MTCAVNDKACSNTSPILHHQRTHPPPLYVCFSIFITSIFKCAALIAQELCKLNDVEMERENVSAHKLPVLNKSKPVLKSICFPGINHEIETATRHCRLSTEMNFVVYFDYLIADISLC